ncbi:hypothetical protein Tco_0009071 [Tanacetum coccineum]
MDRTRCNRFEEANTGGPTWKAEMRTKENDSMRNYRQYVKEVVVETWSALFHMSTAYHRTDGQSGEDYQTWKDLLRACVREFRDRETLSLLDRIVREESEKIYPNQHSRHASRDHTKSDYADKRNYALSFEDKALLTGKVQTRKFPWYSIIACVRIVMTFTPSDNVFRLARLGVVTIGNQSQGYREPGSYTRSGLYPIMATSAIIISSDSSDESVGSPPSWVILFGDIPTGLFYYFSWLLQRLYYCSFIPLGPMLRRTLVASPTGLDPYVATVALGGARVTAHPSSSHEFPIAPVTAPPRIRRRRELYLYQLQISIEALHHLDLQISLIFFQFIFGFFASFYSLGLDAPDQAHSGSSTRDVSPRLCYPPRRAPRCSEAFRHWCAAPLSTWYPPTTSESSSGDSSERPMHLSSHSAGPSRSSSPTRADLSPPRKRFRDSYSSEASIEEDAEVGLTGTGVDMELGIGDGDEVGDHVRIDHRDARDDTEEYEADASAGDMAEVGIDPMTAPLVEEEIVEPAGEDSSDSSGTRDDIVSDQLIASGDRARMAEMIYSLRLENLKVRAMLDIERDRMSSLIFRMSFHRRSFVRLRDRDDAEGDLGGLESLSWEGFGFVHSLLHLTCRTLGQWLGLDDRSTCERSLEAHQVNQILELEMELVMETIMKHEWEWTNEMVMETKWKRERE